MHLTAEQFFQAYSIDLDGGRLGGGAFGTVYKAYDRVNDSWKAVKIGEVKIIDEKKFSLLDEFKAQQQIPLHRNIANYEAVFQFKMQNGIYDYAVMQYYPEGNLKDLLSKNVLTDNQKYDIIRGLLEGIAFMHNYHILHRDLKPGNILISKDFQGNFIPKIADFGLSKMADFNGQSKLGNSFGGGTIEYSSPEQLYGDRLMTNADLWSFGVIVFEILTGKKHFSSDSSILSPETRRSIVYKKVVNAEISEDIDLCPQPYHSIIRWCLKKSPEERVSSAEQLLQVLDQPELMSGFLGESDQYEGETILFKSNNIKDSKVLENLIKNNSFEENQSIAYIGSNFKKIEDNPSQPKEKSAINKNKSFSLNPQQQKEEISDGLHGKSNKNSAWELPKILGHSFLEKAPFRLVITILLLIFMSIAIMWANKFYQNEKINQEANELLEKANFQEALVVLERSSKPDIMKISLIKEAINKYIQIKPLEKGFYRAQLRSNYKWGYLNEDLEESIKAVYTDVEIFNDKGFAIVGINKLFGVIDSKENVVVPLEYSGCSFLTEDACTVILNKSGKSSETFHIPDCK